MVIPGYIRKTKVMIKMGFYYIKALPNRPQEYETYCAKNLELTCKNVKRKKLGERH